MLLRAFFVFHVHSVIRVYWHTFNPAGCSTVERKFYVQRYALALLVNTQKLMIVHS